MVQDNIPAVGAAGYTLLSELDDLTWDSWLSLADVATAMNTKAASQGAIFANGFTNTYLTYLGIALVFNHANLTAANAAAIFNEAGFVVANKALVFREAGLSIANINAIIIHANITDDNAQQILSEITIANRDLTSAANIYEILDDWDDNKLTSRDGAGTTSTGFTNLFAHKDKFRPAWNTVLGSPSASGGIMILPAGNVTDQHVSTPSTFVVGTWEVDWKIVTDAIALARNVFYLMSDAQTYLASENGYALAVQQDQSFDLVRITAGGLTKIIDGGVPFSHGTFYTAKATRDGSGNWEIFLDGVSKGTVLDNNHTTSAYIQVVNELDVVTHYDDLKVY